jgi:hypothetical protein
MIRKEKIIASSEQRRKIGRASRELKRRAQ